MHMLNFHVKKEPKRAIRTRLWPMNDAMVVNLNRGERIGTRCGMRPFCLGLWRVLR